MYKVHPHRHKSVARSDTTVTRMPERYNEERKNIDTRHEREREREKRQALGAISSRAPE